MKVKKVFINICKLIIKLNIQFIIILYFNINREEEFFNNTKNISIFLNKFNLYNNICSFDNSNKYINITDIKYLFSFKFNIVEIEYKFGFYKEYDNKLILPSELLNKNLNLVCFFQILNNNISLYSLSNIYENKYFRCVEYYKINEKINLGIKMYKIKENNDKYFIENKNMISYFFNNKNINYNEMIYKNNSIFDPYILTDKYNKIVKKMNDYRYNKSFKLKKSYIRYPYFLLKRISIIKENIWSYLKIYNNYYCFCKGFDCLYRKISQKCKYYFNLNIIDNNRNVYQKTEFLFIDFIFSELSADDAFPIFKEMFQQNLTVHYLTENTEIYKEFCSNKIECISIIYVDKNNFTVNGNFIEKYLTLFLKLKVVISGGGTNFNYINNLFYNIEYITFISVTHGVCFFKYFLYKDYACYGPKRIDKLLIPPSKKIISLAKKFGWKEENIIKLNLPRWDKYNINDKFLYISDEKNKYKKNSIYFLFTWREIKKKKRISPFYFKNINILFHNDNLKESLKQKNTSLYFSLHHKLYDYKRFMLAFKNYKNFKFIEQNNISKCLSETSLVITDFSSIIFDIIYRGKPFIIYIPDGNDPNINEIYSKNYYQLIDSIKNGIIEFENTFFNINDTINKIIYYINNNFSLDDNLNKFYNNLQIKKEENNTQKLINYVKNIK